MSFFTVYFIWFDDAAEKKKAKDGENSKRDRNERKKGIYFTREDEELGDLGIAQEGGCVQRGALLCVLREEDSHSWYLLVILSKYRRDSTSISSCTYSKVLWFKSERGGIWGTCTLLQCFHCTSETISPLINESNDRKLTINYSDNHLNRLM